MITGPMRKGILKLRPEDQQMTCPNNQNFDIMDVPVSDNICLDNSATTPDLDTTPNPKKPWLRKTIGGTPIKKKKKPASAKHKALKRFVQPKNALMCLNEIKPGAVFTFESEVVKNGVPICVTVEVDGKKFRGMGSSKMLAKQSAAEAALSSFVKPPSLESTETEDPTPWSALASFAMYKLFNEWSERRIQAGKPSPQIFMNAYSATGMNGAANSFEQYLCPSKMLMDKSLTTTSAPHMKPAKGMPANAAEMNPIMLLHQQRPTVQYDFTQEITNGTSQVYVTAVIDGQQFKGNGTNKKKAKLDLARIAVNTLFGIQSTWTQS